LIKQADGPVVYEERAMADLYARKVPIISEGGKFDPNRDQGSFAPESKIKQEVDRLAFLVGPVEVKFGGNEANSRVADLSKYIDRQNGVVKSVTGQIELDWKRGVCRVATPSFAGVSGFLKGAGGQFSLGDVTISSQNEYATIAVAPMDGKPLTSSKKVLVQVGTTAKLTGWTTEKASFKADAGNGKEEMIEGERIVNTGAPPWRVGVAKATVRVKNVGLSKATLLNANGYAVKDVSVKKGDGEVVIELPAETMYLVVQ
jgi:hypothetical protein